MTQPPTPDQVPHRWLLARRDYLAGDTAQVVADRYGLSVRSIYRRASEESWRKADLNQEQIEDPLIWERPTLSGLAQVMPEIRPVIDRNGDDAVSLLIHPTPEVLRDVAFRRAAESAAARNPRDAAAWMRLLVLMERCDASLRCRGRLLDSHDWFRAACVRANWVAYPDGPPEDEDDDDDEEIAPQDSPSP